MTQDLVVTTRLVVRTEVPPVVDHPLCPAISLLKFDTISTLLFYVLGMVSYCSFELEAVLYSLLCTPYRTRFQDPLNSPYYGLSKEGDEMKIVYEH